MSPDVPGPDNPQRPLIDVDRLAVMVEDFGDDEFVRETLQIYLQDLIGKKADLDALARSGDLEDLAGVRGQVHAIGSSSAMVGAKALETKCRSVELQLSEGQAVGAEALQDIVRTCESTERAFLSWLAGDDEVGEHS